MSFSHIFENKTSCDLSEKAMAAHSSTLAWKIPWTEEPGGLPSMGSHRVGHDWINLAAAAAAAAAVTSSKFSELLSLFPYSNDDAGKTWGCDEGE